MRVSKERAADNRQRIVTAAARLFRERGLEGVGVDALMHAAGLTHGSLYSQFGSKGRLAAEALTHAQAVSAERLGDARTLEELVARYLSGAHRDQPGDGCVIAALGSEVARQDASIRHRFTEAVQASARQARGLSPDGEAAADDALAIVATMVGALTLARAVDDPELSDRILAAARRRLGSRSTQAPVAPVRGRGRMRGTGEKRS